MVTGTKTRKVRINGRNGDYVFNWNYVTDGATNLFDLILKRAGYDENSKIYIIDTETFSEPPPLIKLEEVSLEWLESQFAEHEKSYY